MKAKWQLIVLTWKSFAMKELKKTLKELRNEKRRNHIVPEVITLVAIKNRYGKDPLPELRELWTKGVVKYCKTLNDIGFFYYGD